MRIYAEDFLPEKIKYDNLLNLEDFFSLKENILEIFSESGMYLADSGKTWKIISENDKTSKLVENGISFLLDESKIKKIPCFQLPVDHACIETTIFVYNKKYVKLVIEGVYNEEISSKTSINKSDKYSNYMVKNFYFELKQENSKITDLFVKKEINEFLLMLN
jgi:hypothetical protein